MREPQRLSSAGLTLVFAALLFMGAACRRQDENPATSSPTGEAPKISVSTNPPPAQSSYAAVVEKVSLAVVTIRAERRVRAPQQHPFFDDPFFRDFFGNRGQQGPPREQRTSALGSGVIVTSDGYILTNHHVIDGAEEIRVEMIDRRVFSAKVVGSDPPSDLAVLKIDAANLPMLTMGNSDQVRVGDVALAVGNPLGVGQTVTSGIISAKGRSTNLSDGSFEDFLQTDAPINTGNSGGALVNVNGELIGINSQILSPSGGNIGIGFAIPSNMARMVMEQLVQSGKVRRGQLGVLVQNITSDIASSLELQEIRGVIVNQTSPGGAADRAGIQQGDVILAFNGDPVIDSNTLRNKVAGTVPGADVTLTILRNGREQQVKVTVGEFTSDSARQGEQEGQDGGQGGGESDSRFGMSVRPLTPDLAAQLGLRGVSEGLIVADVSPSGAAANAGLQPGDVITRVNGQTVRTAEEMRAALQRSGSRPALLLVNRRGTSSFVTIAPR